MWQGMVPLVDGYRKRIDEEETKTAEELAVSGVGKVRYCCRWEVRCRDVPCLTLLHCGHVQIEPKKHLEADLSQLMALNIVQCLGMMLDTVVF